MTKTTSLPISGFVLILLSILVVCKAQKIRLHLELSATIRENIKGSVHGNKFLWIPQVTLSSTKILEKSESRQRLDYYSLSHIFENETNKLTQKVPKRILSRQYELKKKPHNSDMNCQCTFIEKKKLLGTKKKAKESKNKHKLAIIRSRLKKFLKQRRSHGLKKPSLKTCIRNKSRTNKKFFLCQIYFAKILKELKHRHVSHRTTLSQKISTRLAYILKRPPKKSRSHRNGFLKRKKKSKSKIIVLEINK